VAPIAINARTDSKQKTGINFFIVSSPLAMKCVIRAEAFPAILNGYIHILELEERQSPIQVGLKD
jgi:hypothetical protein